MASADEEGKLRDAEFRLLRDMINAFCGMTFSDDVRYLFERRLRERLRALSLPDFRQYCAYLRDDPKGSLELESAVEVLATNETYFFREEYQLRALSQDIFPEVKRRLRSDGRHTLRIWSAGCSTGEEAYTLGMLVLESDLFEGWDVRIYGNDICRRVLTTARRATYGEASFRVMPPQFLRYFEAVPGGKRVKPKPRSMCHFGHLNLLDRDRSALVGQVDIVLCRNVLIYLDESARRRVVESFYERLVPGGYLLLGHSESLFNAATRFELVHLSSDMVYRKPANAYSEPPRASVLGGSGP